MTQDKRGCGCQPDKHEKTVCRRPGIVGCWCYEKMGNDFWFLPSDVCLYKPVERKKIFTEQGQVLFLKIRDRAKKLVEQSGAVMQCYITQDIGTHDSWEAAACVDRLVELGELREVVRDSCHMQHRIFIGAPKL